MNGDLTFLSLSRGNRIPPSRDNAERLRLMRARLTPIVGNGYFNFRPARDFVWQFRSALIACGWMTELNGSTATEAKHR